jgi:hypothetical protein
MSDPLSYVDELEGLPRDDVARVIGGNLAEAMKVPFAASGEATRSDALV